MVEEENPALRRVFLCLLTEAQPRMALHWQLVRADVAAVQPKAAKLERLEIERSAQALD